MQAIILAAGMGKRLKELTRNNTKCISGQRHLSLIDRLLHQKLDGRQLSQVVIVVGYEGQKLMDYIGTPGYSDPHCHVNKPHLRHRHQHLFAGPGRDWRCARRIRCCSSRTSSLKMRSLTWSMTKGTFPTLVEC